MTLEVISAVLSLAKFYISKYKARRPTIHVLAKVCLHASQKSVRDLDH